MEGKRHFKRKKDKPKALKYFGSTSDSGVYPNEAPASVSDEQTQLNNNNVDKDTSVTKNEVRKKRYKDTSPIKNDDSLKHQKNRPKKLSTNSIENIGLIDYSLSPKNKSDNSSSLAKNNDRNDIISSTEPQASATSNNDAFKQLLPGSDEYASSPSQFIIKSFSDLSNVYETSKLLDKYVFRWLRYVKKVTTKEKPMIEHAIKRFKIVVLNVIPNAEVITFGSYSSSLRLPHGDVDLTIKGVKGAPREILKNLVKHVKPLAHKRLVCAILNAKTPIIRYTDAISGTRIDVNANPETSLVGTDVIKNSLEKFPSLKLLIKINKSLIRKFNLNETSLGGVGSFLLFHMCFAFYLRFGESCKINEDYSDGFAILCLWKYYGMLHNYKRFGIGPNGDFIPLPKSEQDGSLKLVAYSPVNNGIEYGKRAHQIAKVITLFRHALSTCLSITKAKVEYSDSDPLQFLFSDAYKKYMKKYIFNINTLNKGKH